jgi:hypothetical protein
VRVILCVRVCVCVNTLTNHRQTHKKKGGRERGTLVDGSKLMHLIEYLCKMASEALAHDSRFHMQPHLASYYLQWCVNRKKISFKLFKLLCLKPFLTKAEIWLAQTTCGYITVHVEYHPAYRSFFALQDDYYYLYLLF